MAASSDSPPGPGAFEVEEGKGAEDDDRPFVGTGTNGRAAECLSKNCEAGGTGMMVACVFFGAVVGLIVNVSVSDREVLAFWLGEVLAFCSSGRSIVWSLP